MCKHRKCSASCSEHVFVGQIAANRTTDVVVVWQELERELGQLRSTLDSKDNPINVLQDKASRAEPSSEYFEIEFCRGCPTDPHRVARCLPFDLQIQKYKAYKQKRAKKGADRTSRDLGNVILKHGTPESAYLAAEATEVRKQ